MVYIRAILVGSLTIGNGILSSVAGILEEIRGLRFKGKAASAFGSYGWSGEGPKMINELLEEGGFKIVSEGIRELWNPDKDAYERCIEFGKEFVKNL